MSNNKQSMKLYTEEQVRKAIELSRDTHPEGRDYLQREVYDYSDDEVIDLLTPIELPSDEEIEQIASDYRSTSEFCDIENFEDGAVFSIKWLRNKIQGGNT